MVVMAGKSNRRKKQSSNSSSCSSDSDEDPDYAARLPQRLCRQEAFTCSEKYQRKNTYGADEGLHKTASTSILRAKRLCATKKNDNKQREVPLNITLKLVRGKAEPGCLTIERINFGRKKSPMSRRNRKFEDKIGKGNKILMSKRGTSSESEDDHGNHRYYARRKRNQYDEAEKRQKKATIFSWLIDSKIIEQHEEVFYMDDYNQKITK